MDRQMAHVTDKFEAVSKTACGADNIFGKFFISYRTHLKSYVYEKIEPSGVMYE